VRPCLNRHNQVAHKGLVLEDQSDCSRRFQHGRYVTAIRNNYSPEHGILAKPCYRFATEFLSIGGVASVRFSILVFRKNVKDIPSDLGLLVSHGPGQTRVVTADYFERFAASSSQSLLPNPHPLCLLRIVQDRCQVYPTFDLMSYRCCGRARRVGRIVEPIASGLSKLVDCLWRYGH
jgi:hypothetical protein